MGLINHDRTSSKPATTITFHNEWKQFQRAFLKSKEPFHPYHWIYRLFQAMIQDIKSYTGLSSTNGRDIIPWRPMIPIFATLLIVLISTSYFMKLRHDLIQPQYCNSKDNNNDKAGYWVYTHDGIVIYLTVMILYHFIQASALSPGVMVTTNVPSTSWHLSRKKRNVDTETKLLQRYGDIPTMPVVSTTNIHPGSSMKFHPSPYRSTCSKCHVDATILRPPRCHHCSVCNECILQYDHHCIWLNNCIGYNNVRHFILLLFFVSVGCYYGIIILYQPFYLPIQNTLRQYNGLIPYLQKYFAKELPADEATLFDIPTLEYITHTVFTSHDPVPVQIIIDLLFPLLFGIGGIIIIFFGTHVKFICTARTTLEHRIYLEHQYQQLLLSVATRTKRRSKVNRDKSQTWVNLFDQGSYYRNWVQIMGHDWIYTMFLPIHVDSPLPYLPKDTNSIVLPNHEKKEL